MHYAILCCHDEKVVCSWTKEQDDEVITRLMAVQERWASEKRLGPVARLGPTTTARTLHKDRIPFHITDGPFAETKEQILGFYVVDCASMDEALAFAGELAEVNPGGAYEVRPVTLLLDSTLPTT